MQSIIRYHDSVLLIFMEWSKVMLFSENYHFTIIYILLYFKNPHKSKKWSCSINLYIWNRLLNTKDWFSGKSNYSMNQLKEQFELVLSSSSQKKPIELYKYLQKVCLEWNFRLFYLLYLWKFKELTSLLL